MGRRASSSSGRRSDGRSRRRGSLARTFKLWVGAAMAVPVGGHLRPRPCSPPSSICRRSSSSVSTYRQSSLVEHLVLRRRRFLPRGACASIAGAACAACAARTHSGGGAVIEAILEYTGRCLRMRGWCWDRNCSYDRFHGTGPPSDVRGLLLAKSQVKFVKFFSFSSF